MKFFHGPLFAIIMMTLSLFGNVEGQSNTFDLSVHIIDTGKGRAAPEVPVKLHKLKSGDDWILVSQGYVSNFALLLDKRILKSNFFLFSIGKRELMADWLISHLLVYNLQEELTNFRSELRITITQLARKRYFQL